MNRIERNGNMNVVGTEFNGSRVDDPQTVVAAENITTASPDAHYHLRLSMMTTPSHSNEHDRELLQLHSK